MVAGKDGLIQWILNVFNNRKMYLLNAGYEINELL